MSGSNVGADFWMSEYITPWDIYSHGVTGVLAHKKTAYQEMYIVETGTYGKALVLDGKWQSCTGDEFLYHEPLVHPALIFHGTPRKVLILGGGEGATAREVLRWQTVEKVVMIDIDGEVVEACRQHLGEMHQNAFDDSRLEVVIADALDFLDTTDERWDVVISDLSDPIESGPSFALFTKEYFEKIRRVLSPQGFVVIQAGPVSPGELTLHARLVRTLNAVFPNVQSYSSYTSTYGRPWGFAVASEAKIDTRPEPETINQLLQEKTSGGFRMLDGTTLLGMLHLPLHLRKAIAQETQVYTLAEPPKFFGQGAVKQTA
ncbi:fused MFS/spermidine synthase [Scytonema sp. PCC 10023]|uniref:fused MFS/spermidine synthase n=1 Tax=Scytonema sp. PCC 10023 TaxID=1680591 RepID=UPI0039C677CA